MPQGLKILKNDQTQVVLQSNLVSDSILGEKLLPIMDILLTEKIGLFSLSKSHFYELAHPIFRNLQKFEFSSIDIWFTDIQGTPIKFNIHSNIGITVILMFRKKK